MTLGDHLVVALGWAGFGLVHSWLAREGPKGWLKARFGGGHRLVYNAVAAVHLLGAFALGEWTFEARAFDRPDGLAGLGWAMQVAGLVVLITAMRGYDGARLLGLAQLRDARADDETEGFTTAGLNAYVRHPLYFGALLILWGRVDGEASLTTAIWLTAYLVIGSRFEERALIARFGTPYRAYRARVPGLLPWKGKAWPAAGAR